MIGKEEKSKGFTNQLVKIKIKTRGYYEIKRFQFSGKNVTRRF